MNKVWLSYAWTDNEDNDVDFIAQELERSGIDVRIDRWKLGAGKRLWEQIEGFICNESESDAWILFTTTKSLNSEACKEELAYALDRTLNSRGKEFPIIGLFPSTIDNDLIPAAIRTRLYISLNDTDWKERILAAVQGTTPSITRPSIRPYAISYHDFRVDGHIFKVVEIRTRAGSWTPSFVGIPYVEKSYVNPKYKYGPRGVYDLSTVKYHCGEGESEDGNWWLMFASNEVTPSTSLYLICDVLPTKFCFGIYNGIEQYIVDIQ